MTTNNTASMFNLPEVTITADELRQSMPKARRMGKNSRFTLEPHAAERLMELGRLLGKLTPDDPRPQFHWTVVATVVFNELKGGKAAFALANRWAAKGKAYVGLAKFRKFWSRLNPMHPNPVKIATLHWMIAENAKRQQAVQAKPQAKGAA